MFLGFTKTKRSKNQKSPFLSNLHLLLYQPLYFAGKIYPLPDFLDN